MIALSQVQKQYKTSAGLFPALADITLEFKPGELVTIVGRSGSGKSTLLNLLSGIDRPTSGSVRVAGTTVSSLSAAQLPRWRGRTVGIVFQFFQLLPTLTALENVMLPMDLCAVFPERERRARALAMLERVNVQAQADKLPATLSGGEQQRVAIARALANDPPVLLADEPTGNLDSETSAGVAELLRGLALEGKAVLVVTHERDTFVSHRTVTLADGRVVA